MLFVLLILVQMLTITIYISFHSMHVARSIVFFVMFFRSLFVLFTLFFWPFSCLSFSDLRLLITPFVSSNYYFITIYSLFLFYSLLIRCDVQVCDCKICCLPDILCKTFMKMLYANWNHAFDIFVFD